MQPTPGNDPLANQPTEPERGPTPPRLPGTAADQPAPTTPQPIAAEPAPAVPTPETPNPVPLTTPAPNIATDAVVTGGDSSAPVPSAPLGQGDPRKSRKKLLLFGSLAAVVVLLGAAGWVFGMYLPNRPTTVWRTGLDRTGQALDAIVNDATSQEHLEQIKASQLTGDVRYKADSWTVTGKVSGQFDDDNSDSNLNVKIDAGGEQPIDVSAKLRTIKADAKAQYPDIYFQLSGISGLGLDFFAPGIDQYDGKWIVLTGDYLSETIGGEPSQDEQPLSVAETTEAARAVTGTVRDYFLTSDPDKAVIELKQFVGKEQVDGVDAYHYTASINKAHGEAFCSALGDTIATTKAFKKLVAADDRSDRQKSIVHGCKDGFKDLKSSDTFDLWVDAKYKLIHKIRIYDDDKKSYLDLGQRYTGGDDVTVFMAMHLDNEKLDISGTLKFDFKAYTFSSHIEGEQKGDSAYTFEANLSGKSSKSSVEPVKPADATDFRALMQAIEANSQQQMQSYPTDFTTDENNVDTCDNTDPYSGACALSVDTRFD